jgi:hypothetical protein
MDCNLVVIPLLEVVHVLLKFLYNRQGLRVFGNTLDGNVASYLPYLIPVLTLTGRVAKKQQG